MERTLPPPAQASDPPDRRENPYLREILRASAPADHREEAAPGPPAQRNPG